MFPVVNDVYAASQSLFKRILKMHQREQIRFSHLNHDVNIAARPSLTAGDGTKYTDTRNPVLLLQHGFHSPEFIKNFVLHQHFQ